MEGIISVISALFEALIMLIVEVLLRAVNFCTKKLGIRGKL
jgi:hypothetical protein